VCRSDRSGNVISSSTKWQDTCIQTRDMWFHLSMSKLVQSGANVVYSKDVTSTIEYGKDYHDSFDQSAFDNTHKPKIIYLPRYSELVL
jgi:hypothetical protein